MSNIIVYLSVDKNREEWIFSEVPKRFNDTYWSSMSGEFVELPFGTIKKLTGRSITWENDYIEYVGDNYDPTID